MSSNGGSGGGSQGMGSGSYAIGGSGDANTPMTRSRPQHAFVGRHRAIGDVISKGRSHAEAMRSVPGPVYCTDCINPGINADTKGRVDYASSISDNPQFP